MARFRTRARTVDMLGRQQIAGSSTAINELFKNAHDAYADHVEADFFKSDLLLVIRDDGIGMTREEFESNWLVLGTDSKVTAIDEGGSRTPPGKPERVIMGEKGIGRLAIAFLGPQVLVLTRSSKGKQPGTLVMCYIHWGLFEQPTLNLEDIEIPIETIDDGKLPTARQVRSLLAENEANIAALQERFPECDLSTILSDVKDFQIDPQDFVDAVGGPSLADGGCGTHFYIAPADESILADIEAERESKTKEFSKCLLGFCNSTFHENEDSVLETSFRFWPTNTRNEDLIGTHEFFTKDELGISDQYVCGEIDEFGQFKGTVRVYDQEYLDHVISWPDGGGKTTACGPLKVEFGYLQGEQRASLADADDWAMLNRKLEAIGGLYVYRDRLRILPYGNSDVDWLDIEQRRNKGAGYYYFSYRRIYGAVSLTRARNDALREKAGREGFQKNKAYRQLKSVLENLFIQLAADFYRKEAPLGDYFRERKHELERLEKARRKREQQTTAKRNRLRAQLEEFFKKAQESRPEAETKQLMDYVRDRMNSAASMKDPDAASEELLGAEREANLRLAEIRAAYTVARPRGVGLTKALTRDWQAYRQELERLEEKVFGPFVRTVSETLGSMAEQARIYIDQRQRLQELIKNAAEKQTAIIKTEAAELTTTAGETRKASLETTRSAIRELRDVIEEVKDDLAHKDLANLPPDRIEAIRAEYERRIDDVAARNSEKLGGVRELLAGIAEGLEKKIDVSQLDMTEAMETELQSLQEQADADEELVQLGLAVAIINHEFEAAIRMIRNQLTELRAWARENDDLLPIYNEIRANFDHLDAHLNLFTPLQRRMYRHRIDITGNQILDYIRTLFAVRLDRHHIRLEATQEFLESSLHSFPSTIYPVFVNLIDNFIFWLKDRAGARLITLDCLGQAYLIQNNGPPIHARDVEAVFEQGFSRKPHGRGLGLFISRRVLQKEGMALALNRQVPDGEGVQFVLSWGDVRNED